MSGSDIQCLISDMRGDYLKITILLLYLSKELLKPVAERGTLWEATKADPVPLSARM